MGRLRVHARAVAVTRNTYGIDTNESARSPRVRGMVALRRSGKTYDYIGRYYGISRQRVHQLLEDFRLATERRAQ